jgi:hypothetical protein
MCLFVHIIPAHRLTAAHVEVANCKAQLIHANEAATTSAAALATAREQAAADVTSATALEGAQQAQLDQLQL